MSRVMFVLVVQCSSFNNTIIGEFNIYIYMELTAEYWSTLLEIYNKPGKHV